MIKCCTILYYRVASRTFHILQIIFPFPYLNLTTNHTLTTAGNTTVNEYAQIPVDHSLIKTILHVAMMFWFLRVISGSTSYLSRKSVFCC